MYDWAENQKKVVAPSIFRAAEFGRYVITRFLEDVYFYDHLPTVYIQLHLYWFQCTFLRLFISAIGSSLFTRLTY